MSDPTQQYQYIKLPDGSYGQFRADAGDDVIKSAIEKDFPGTYAPNAGLAGVAAPNTPMYQVNRLTGSQDLLSEQEKANLQPRVESGLRDYYQHNPAGMYGMGVASNLAQAGQDFSQGNIKKGIHSTIKGVGIASAPLAIPALAAAPVATAGAVGGGLLGSTVGSGGAKLFGASPETQDVAGDVGGLLGGGAGAYGASRIAGMLPSKQAAGALFNQARAAAGPNAIDVSKPGDIALQIREAAQSGGKLPKVVRDFITRATDPDRGPITYDEARQFYQNAGSLAVNERNGLNANTLRLLNQFRVSLGQSIQQTANQAGVGPQYSGAMSQYGKAMTLQDFLGMLKRGAVNTGARAIGDAAGLGTAYGLYRYFTGGRK